LIHLFLRHAVGVGGRADEGTLEDDWRRAKARALAAGFAARRGVFQYWPQTTTDLLEEWESALGLRRQTLNEQGRRDQIVEMLTRDVHADGPTVTDALQEIDPLFSIVDYDEDTSCVVGCHGRAFGDWIPGSGACGPAFGFAGGVTGSILPNLSHRFRVFVLYNIGALPTVDQLRNITAAGVVLAEYLPAWVDWEIGIFSGFHVDVDFLDYTGLT
jgi:hypothetical protein